MGVVLSIVLLVVAGALFLIVKKGWIDNSTLQTLANVAGIVALLAAVAVFIFPQPTSNHVISTLPPPSNDTSSNEFPKKHYPQKTFNVILVLPSRMSDAVILVDGKPAIIVNKTPTVATIRVVEKAAPHQILLQKDEYSCSKEVMIVQNNIRLQPCQ